MIIIFITCKNQKEAEKIGIGLLKKRLAACIVLIPKVPSAYFWSPSYAGRTSPRSKRGEPPYSKIERSSEAILLVKTLKNKFTAVEREVKRLHSHTVPFIAEIPVTKINKDYLKWLERELK